MAKLYDTNSTDGQHLKFEEMRIIEEVIIQADHQLKSEINS